MTSLQISRLALRARKLSDALNAAGLSDSASLMKPVILSVVQHGLDAYKEENP